MSWSIWEVSERHLKGFGQNSLLFASCVYVVFSACSSPHILNPGGFDANHTGRTLKGLQGGIGGDGRVDEREKWSRGMGASGVCQQEVSNFLPRLLACDSQKREKENE